jgi:tRNA-binding protein
MEITYSDFEKVEMRIGTIVHAEVFAEARKPAYKLTIDFGSEIGIKRSSAQITTHYTPEDLLHKQVVAVINFPAKQIGPLMSECLVLGAVGMEGDVVLLQPERSIPNGLRIS